MAAFTKIEDFAKQVAEKAHNLSTDTLKVALSNTAINAATATQLSDVTQISTNGGYAAATVTGLSGTEASGVYKLATSNNVTFTASGAAFDTFRYVVLYNDSATNDLLIGYWDYGSAVDITDGNSFTVDFDDTNGVLTLQ
tara:strand:- start:1458 stop:1877 length:420 start_codon:yes stop_codon:yes gene_type:complete